MSNCPECDASLKKAQQGGEPWGYCSEVHCNNATNYIQQFCNCQGQFSGPPFIQNGVCINSPGSLVPIASLGCFCCCGCSLSGTRIAVSKTEFKSVNDFNINDMVWVAKDASLKTWVQKPVLFSSGTGSIGKNVFLKIYFGDQETGTLVTPQSFVSKSVTLQQAKDYYKILSTPPNDFISKGGAINLRIVHQASADVIAELLAVSIEVAQSIYFILSTDPDYIIVTTLQPLLMKDGSLKQAEKLVPGKDTLVSKNGSTIPVTSIETSLLVKGVHHISTSIEKASSLEGHLLLANGIVIGDYATQIALSIENSAIEDKYKNDPTFGTKEYNEANIHLVTALSMARVKTEQGENLIH